LRIRNPRKPKEWKEKFVAIDTEKSRMAFYSAKKGLSRFNIEKQKPQVYVDLTPDSRMASIVQLPNIPGSIARDMCFHVITPKQTMHFCAQGRRDKMVWMLAMRCCIVGIDCSVAICSSAAARQAAWAAAAAFKAAVMAATAVAGVRKTKQIAGNMTQRRQQACLEADLRAQSYAWSSTQLVVRLEQEQLSQTEQLREFDADGIVGEEDVQVSVCYLP
jgi:hypothetical protein